MALEPVGSSTTYYRAGDKGNLEEGQVLRGYYQKTLTKDFRGTPSHTYFFVEEDKQTQFAINGTSYLANDMKAVGVGNLCEVKLLGRVTDKYGNNPFKWQVMQDKEDKFIEEQASDTPDQASNPKYSADDIPL